MQEENESYNILLRERTLNGSFDINRHRVASPEADDEKVEFPHDTRPASAAGRSGLDTLSEVEELVPPHRDESPARTPARSRKNSSRRGGSSSIRSGSPGRVGESLADLPVAGPGLDLAAEMGRAENKDMRAPPSSFDSEASAKKTKEGIIIERQEKQIRSLTDENRALSLYSSKILDRIISMDGFERVLAVDYEKQTPPPSQAPAPKPRSMLPRSLSISTQASSTAQFVTSPTPASPTPAPEMTKRARRGLSMDWTKSLWGGSSASSTLSSTVPDTKKLEGLRPFTLDPSNSVVRNAKKLDTQEDEEDRVERARLEATMKLMGIEKPVSASPILGVSPQVSRRTSPTPSLRSESGVAAPVPAPPPVPASIPLSARIPFFGRGKSEPAIPINNLTKEALTHATAESSLAALEARERILSAEIARGKNGGFTELGNYGSPRSSLSETRRRKRLGSGSGGSVSTLFSAGRMSRAGSTGGVEEENEQDTEVVAMMTETEVGAAPAPPS